MQGTPSSWSSPAPAEIAATLVAAAVGFVGWATVAAIVVLQLQPRPPPALELERAAAAAHVHLDGDRTLAAGPREFPKVLTVGTVTPVAVVHSNGHAYDVARCNVVTASRAVYIVEPTETVATNGVGPYGIGQTLGPVLPPLGTAWLLATGGSTSVSCGFSEGWSTMPATSPTPAAASVTLTSGANNRLAVFDSAAGITGTTHLTYPTLDSVSHDLVIDGSDDLGANLQVNGAGHNVAVKVYHVPSVFGASGAYLGISDSAGNACGTGRATTDQGDACVVAKRSVVGGSLWLLAYDGYGLRVDRNRGDAVVVDIAQDWTEVAEGSVTTGAGRTSCHADSTSHALRCNENNDGWADLQRAVTTTLATDQTSSSTSLTTGFSSPTLFVGTWHCHAHGRLAESVAADGVKVDVSTTTTNAVAKTYYAMTLTNFTSTPPAALDGLSSAGATVSATLFGASTTKAVFDLETTLAVTAAGVVQIKFAQNAHSTGTATLNSGSMITCQQTSGT